MDETTKAESFAVPTEKLRWVCPEDMFPFECTTDIEPLKEFIGQERAIDSIDFGLKLERAGYNLFLTGLTGTGKASTVKTKLERFIEKRKAEGIVYHLNDWCYVHDFSDHDHPRILKLPQGLGRAFANDMDELVKRLKDEVPKTFGSEEFNKQKQDILSEHQKKYQASMDALEKEAKEKSLMVQLSPVGAAVVPLVDGEPMSREDFLNLPEAEKEKIEAKRLEMMRKVEDAYAQLHDFEKEVGEKLKEIERKAGEFAISGLFDDLMKSYREHQEVLDFLQDAKKYTLEHLDLFIQAPAQPPFPVPQAQQVDTFLAYRVNLFVDNSSLSGPPIIIEPNPHWFNMFGKIERRALMGTYLSDHTMIKAGAVQLANGGYLILNIRDVVLNPGVWEGLKRVIKSKEVRTEDPGEQFGFFIPLGMRPQPMPVDLKTIAMGDDYLYQLLTIYDEDFWEMFKVKADFDYEMKRTAENVKSYTCFIRRCCDEDRLLPFDRSGVAKVLEYAARTVDDQEKLSARFGPLRDLLIEADYWTRNAGSEMITGGFVEKAVKEKIHRLDL
ncbi:MAG: ATP-binding protein, partial [Nitrospirota bacterium]